jgi:hypothetical protein
VKTPVLAVCSDPECVNNENARQTLCCSACGKCGEHSHQDCEELRAAYGRTE